MSLFDAIRAAEDNINNHVSADRDPVMYNVSVALLNIAQALRQIQNDVGGVEKLVKRLQ